MKYTYTPDAVLENISYFSIKLSNHFSGASTASVKIAVVLEDNSVVYLLGDANTFYDFHVTTGLEQFEKALDAPVNVKAFYIVFKSALNSAYLYMDDVTFAKIKE